MTVARVQHVFNPKSGQPEDQVVNTFYFHKVGAVGLTVTDCTALDGLVNNFYDALPAGTTTTIMSHMATAQFMPNRNTNVFYDMDQAQPRQPVARITTPPVISNNTVQPMPSEVAVCLSYRGALLSGSNPARRRGRIFIGPLTTATNNFSNPTDSTGQIRPDASLCQAMLKAALAMKTAASGQGWKWVVYSPTARGAGDAASACTDIVHCWVDDAFDTQRRRGVKPSGRYLQDV